MNAETWDLVVELHGLHHHLTRAIEALNRTPADYATAAHALDVLITEAPLLQGIYETVRDRDASPPAPPK
jgi:hypothetical protein